MAISGRWNGDLFRLSALKVPTKCASHDWDNELGEASEKIFTCEAHMDQALRPKD